MSPETIVEAFGSAQTTIISDNFERVPGMVGLRPYHHVTRRMAGRVLTVRVAAGDNLFIYKALDIIRAGDVFVIDAEGATNRAVLGEIIIAIAKSHGAAGFVVDGAIRVWVSSPQVSFPALPGA